MQQADKVHSKDMDFKASSFIVDGYRTPVSSCSDTESVTKSDRCIHRMDQPNVVGMENDEATVLPTSTLGTDSQSDLSFSQDDSDFPPLTHFDISPISGFVPEQSPLKQLPNLPTFQPWDVMMKHLPGILLTSTFHTRIHHLPVLTPEFLEKTMTTVPLLTRLYLTLSFLTQCYIWNRHSSTESPRMAIPRILSIPLVWVCKHLGIRPIITHSVVDLYNYEFLDPTLPKDKRYSVDNMVTLNTFTGSSDESWFYFSTTRVELMGGKALDAMRNVCINAKGVLEDSESRLESSSSSDPRTPSTISALTSIESSLDVLSTALKAMSTYLHDMNHHCDPTVFYHQIRHYHRGWPDTGIIYSGISREDIPTTWPVVEGLQGDDGVRLVLPGASAAQSTTIRAFDVFLGVPHWPTGEGPYQQLTHKKPQHVSPTTTTPSTHHHEHARQIPTRSPSISSLTSTSHLTRSQSTPLPASHTANQPFFLDMHEHMPSPHRAFLLTLSAHSHWLTYLLRSTVCTEGVREAYRRARMELVRFRDAHIRLVTRYIMIPKRRGMNMVGMGPGVTGSVPSTISTTTSTTTSTSSSYKSEDKHPKGGQKSWRCKLPWKSDPSISPTATPTSTATSPHHSEPHADHDGILTGTGGTDLIPFLKQARDETKHFDV